MVNFLHVKPAGRSSSHLEAPKVAVEDCLSRYVPRLHAPCHDGGFDDMACRWLLLQWRRRGQSGVRLHLLLLVPKHFHLLWVDEVRNGLPTFGRKLVAVSVVRVVAIWRLLFLALTLVLVGVLLFFERRHRQLAGRQDGGYKRVNLHILGRWQSERNGLGDGKERNSSGSVTAGVEIQMHLPDVGVQMLLAGLPEQGPGPMHAGLGCGLGILGLRQHDLEPHVLAESEALLPEH